MAAVDMTRIKDSVSKIKGAAASARVLIGEFAKEVRRLGEQTTVDPADLTALADEMDSEAGPLAQAVADNPDPNPND